MTTPRHTAQPGYKAQRTRATTPTAQHALARPLSIPSLAVSLFRSLAPPPPGATTAPAARIVLAALLFFFPLCAHAHTTDQQTSPWIPPDAVAWWSFDPSHFGRHRNADSAQTEPRGAGSGGVGGVAESALRIASASGLVTDPDAAAMVDALLGAAVVGAVPHTLAILRFSAQPGDGDDSMRITDLAAVLELRTRADHRRFLRTIQTILVDAPRARDGAPEPSGTQRVIELPNGRQAVQYTQPDWPDWRKVSWTSTDDAFLVAIGDGALEQWFHALDRRNRPDAPQPYWQHHRRALDDAQRAGDVFLETYYDINALRRAFPEAFADGRSGELLRIAGLSNARSFMLHAARAEPPPPDQRAQTQPPLIAIDATWSARSDPPGTIGHQPLSESRWPRARTRLPPPPGSYAIVIDAQPRQLLETALDAYAASLKDDARARFNNARRIWQRNHSAPLRRTLASLTGWIVISDYPPPPVRAPGVATVYMELWPSAVPDRFSLDMRNLMSAFEDRVAYDQRRDIWSLRLDPDGLVRVISWGRAGDPPVHAVVGGVDLAIGPARGVGIVEQNRKWLRGRADGTTQQGP